METVNLLKDNDSFIMQDKSTASYRNYKLSPDEIVSLSNKEEIREESGLTDKEIDTIVNTAEDSRISMPKVEVNPDAELEVGEAEVFNGKVVGVSAEGAKNIIETVTGEKVEEANNSVDLLTIQSGEEARVDDSVSIEATANTVKDTFDLSDEEIIQVVECLTNMKKDPKYPVFTNLPGKMQVAISKLAFDNNVNPDKLNDISRMVMQEMIDQSDLDQSLIDLEKALDDALNVPSIVDMYSEHTREVMEKNIPETIEQIKDEFPEKAERLQAIRDAFHSGYEFKFAKETYVNNARLRKAMRRYNMEYERSIGLYNYMNEKSNFKMNDAHQIFSALEKVFITDLDKSFSVYKESNEKLPEMEQKLVDLAVTEEDIKKFCILITKSCENLDPNDPVDAAYMYYLVRNIISLNHVNESKTEFAVELINNICDTITFIRDKESEFRESNSMQSKHAGRNSKVKR